MENDFHSPFLFENFSRNEATDTTGAKYT